MENLSFIMTIFFMLIGPLKLIPAFSQLTGGMDSRFKRAVALRAALIATAICAVVVVVGEGLVSRYRLSVQSLQITVGLVLLISALNTVFPRPQPTAPTSAKPTALQLALMPLSTPVIVPPAGVAAILVFVMLAPRYPGMYQAIAISIALMMALDFLAMFFNDRIITLPGLLPLLQLLGAVLIVVQVAFAIQVLLDAFKTLGVFTS